MNFFSNLVFLNPWILSGLAALPVLWWLLRITPPAPKLITLPTTRFLKDLIPEKQTPSHTPWWILLLRLIIAGLVILALAGPVYNPASQLDKSGPLRIVIDNGWASAQTWDSQSKAAMEILSEAGREKREVHIVTTAPVPGEETPFIQGPLSAAQAESIVKGLKPLPWEADYKRTAESIKETSPASLDTIWFSHGLDEGGFDVLAAVLKQQGNLNVLTPPAEQLPMALRLPEKSGAGVFQIEVLSPAQIPPGRTVSLQALDLNGAIVDQKSAALQPGKETIITFETPEKIRGDIAQIRLAGARGVGGLYILDDRFSKKSIGLIGPSGETDPKPFIEARFYLSRALEPFTSLSEGTAEEVLNARPAAIIMPDIASLAPESLNTLEQWVRNGGLLLRFAGPNMAQAQGENFLVPTPLRSGGRALDGSLSWDQPQKLQPFTAESPLYGIVPHEKIIVRQQVLAEPVPDLAEKTWARLEDGTPLITASPLDKGLLVMIHTSADAGWSDLPLSGAFVDILKRIVSLAGQAPDKSVSGGGMMEPLQVLDGFGAFKSPDSTVQSIPAPDFAITKPGPSHPPGYYGSGGVQRALNLGDHIKSLNTFSGSGVNYKSYGQNFERDLMPYILYLALALLLFDWAVMMAIAGAARPFIRFAGLSVLLLALPAQAATPTQDVTYADGLYLAYIRSGDPSLDYLSEKGLENLSAVLKRRTSVEPDGVVALNPETDTLIFFPFIYWPVSRLQGALSETALANIQHYLDHGGTILFDTRDGVSDGANGAHLRQLVSRLTIPALAPIPDDHVLLRAFYLLRNAPGRFEDGALWVETQSVSGRDNVSSVIVGSNDWAGAWAESGGDSYLSGSTRNQELALRFGVNVTMYALTGNYKADQVHVKNILERLGQ